MVKKIGVFLLTAAMLLTLAGCGSSSSASSSAAAEPTSEASQADSSVAESSETEVSGTESDAETSDTVSISLDEMLAEAEPENDLKAAALAVPMVEIKILSACQSIQDAEMTDNQDFLNEYQEWEKMLYHSGDELGISGKVNSWLEDAEESGSDTVAEQNAEAISECMEELRTIWDQADAWEKQPEATAEARQ